MTLPYNNNKNNIYLKSNIQKSFVQYNILKINMWTSEAEQLTYQLTDIPAQKRSHNNTK